MYYRSGRLYSGRSGKGWNEEGRVRREEKMIKNKQEEDRERMNSGKEKKNGRKKIYCVNVEKEGKRKRKNV